MVARKKKVEWPQNVRESQKENCKEQVVLGALNGLKFYPLVAVEPVLIYSFFM